MTFCSTLHERVKGTKYLWNKKNEKIKVCELDLEKWKYCGKIVNEEIFIAFTYLFMDFILLWHKIT